MSTDLLLSLATLLLGGSFAMPLLFPGWAIWLRALWHVSTLILLTVLVHRVFGSPLQPEFHADGPLGLIWQQAIGAGWWVAAARGLAGVARLLLSLQSQSRETQILSDLVGAAIYVATALAVIDVVFAIPVGGLIATSGVIAVVIGLALQSTLSDVFSGIAIDIERPYRAGDMLSVEGGVKGRVREVNWRSTLITTGNGDVAVVPNSVMAKARLVNHSLPAPLRRASVEVRLDPRVTPERCLTTLDAAVQACRLLLTDPPPTVAQTALRGDGAVYEISFSVSGAETFGPARTEVLGQVQRHLFHAAIPLAVDGLAQVPSLVPPTAADLLARSDLFGLLAAPDRELLAGAMAEVHLAPGQVLIRQDEVAGALFLLTSGTVGILRREPDGKELTHRLGPGMSLGLIGLITASPYGTKATALTSVKAFRLDRAAIKDAVTERPSLAKSLEQLAHRNQTAMSADIAAARDLQHEQPEVFRSRMRDFLQRLVAGLGPGTPQ